MAIVSLEAEGPDWTPERALREFAASDDPFDSWYRGRMREIFGCDIERSPRAPGGELLFGWREAPARPSRGSRGTRDPTPTYDEWKSAKRERRALSEAQGIRHLGGASETDKLQSPTATRAIRRRTERCGVSAKYHPGEIEVQERAGVRSMAERVGNSIRPTIPPAVREFLGELPMVVVGSVGADGRVWASLLVGYPGFVRALDESSVRIDAAPLPGDPLAEALQGVGSEVGVLAIDLATRRRVRLNGEAESYPESLYIRTHQVYVNCPKYIQVREPETGGTKPGLEDGHVLRSHWLTDEQRSLISDADTFFIASSHPEGGTDASHRGGKPGFVGFLSDAALEFPDYSGNTMFNTLGNIAVKPSAGLLFLDFEGGGTLQPTGEARIVWDPGRAARFAGAERVVEFRVEEAIQTRGVVSLRWRLKGYSPLNPA